MMFYSHETRSIMVRTNRVRGRGQGRALSPASTQPIISWILTLTTMGTSPIAHELLWCLYCISGIRPHCTWVWWFFRYIGCKPMHMFYLACMWFYMLGMDPHGQDYYRRKIYWLYYVIYLKMHILRWLLL